MRNIEITKANISRVPMDWLQMRYQKIERKIESSAPVDARLLSEKAIIDEYLREKGYYNQMELSIPIPQREQYVAIVEEQLQEYYRLTYKKKRLEEEWDFQYRVCPPEMPRITSSTGGGGKSIGLLSKPTEEAVLKPYEKMEQLEREMERIEERLYPVRRALETLDPPQLDLITAKYLAKAPPIPYDSVVMDTLLMNRQKYYDVKKVALLRIAQSLRLV